jgi:hypothetical protein
MAVSEGSQMFLSRQYLGTMLLMAFLNDALWLSGMPYLENLTQFKVNAIN